MSKPDEHPSLPQPAWKAALSARLHRAWHSVPNQMALMSAVRGTVAIMVPLVALQLLGEPAGAVIAAIGGLNTAMSDAGGAYRRRVLVMLLVTLIGSASLFIGCQLHGDAWLAAPVLFVIAFTAGMARVFGQPGVSLGIDASIAFLVGVLTPQGAAAGLGLAAHYALGSLWAIVFTLFLWRLRPYRRLFQQVAAAYQACAEIVAALGTDGWQRRRTAGLQLALRDAIRQGEEVLDSTRAGAGHSNRVFDRCVELLYAVSREGAAAANLGFLLVGAGRQLSAERWQQASRSWQAALHGVAGVLLKRKGRVELHDMQVRFAAFAGEPGFPGALRPPLQLALVHLEAAVETLHKLIDSPHSFREWWPRLSLQNLRDAVAKLAAQLNFQSFIFRHALRVAVAASVAQWLAGWLGLTHQLWMPMTVILVLQPEFGATWRRMLQRIAGTLAGVVIAGGLHFLLHGSVAESGLIAVCAFGTFLMIRRHYGVGVTMLTPMVLLLLGVLVPRSGALILARGSDTVLGAVLALAAAYLLWPAWQKRALLPQFRKALDANRGFLSAVLEAARRGRTVHTDVMQARHRAERETDNADAVFQRMLAEPAHTRMPLRPALAFSTYLRRFTEHVLGLAVALEGEILPASAELAGTGLLGTLDDIAASLAGRPHGPTTGAVPAAAKAVPKEAGALRAWFLRLEVDAAALQSAADSIMSGYRTTKPPAPHVSSESKPATR